MAHDLQIAIGPVDADLKRAQTAHASPSLGVSVFARANFNDNNAKAPAIALGNVIPFRGRKERERHSAPAVEFAPSERPAPLLARYSGPWKGALLLAFSLVLHAGLFAAFNRPAPPKASIGFEVITVELELGSNAIAGQAERPSPSQDIQNSAAAEANSEPPAVEETKKPEAKQEVASTPPIVDETPQPTQKVSKPFPEPPRPPVVESKPKKVPAPTPKPEKEKKHTPSSETSETRTASSGIGRGRSDATSNYAGAVHAHLSRFGRRMDNQGNGRVWFKLDGGGRVISVKLVQAPGIESLDREAVAMVQRASPFPPPPGGRPMDFTAPVNFRY